MAILGSSYYYDDNMTGMDNLTQNFETEWDESMWELVIEDFKQSQFTHTETTTIVLIALYVPIFVTSLIGNVLVLLVILPNRRMWSVTNNFLVNLAVADLLVTVLCMPMTVARKIYLPWIYGDVLCKMTPYLQGVSVTSSTFTITAMSLDRCLAILHPMRFRNLRTKGNVRILIIIVWVTSMLLMLPLIFVNQTKTEQIFDGIKITSCTEEWLSLFQRRAYDFSLLFIVCLIPAQIVFVSYVLMGKRLWVTDSQLKGNEQTKYIHSGSTSEKSGTDPIRANRRRIAKMCIFVSIIFVVCWLPYYTVNIYLDFKRDNGALDIVYWGLLVGHLHCITNPILYCFMHKTFRHCVKRLMPCWRARLLRTQSAYGASAFTRHRMASFMTSAKSKSSSARKKDNTDSRNRLGVASVRQQLKSEGSTEDLAICDNDKPLPNTRLYPGGVECTTTDHDPPPRKVQLIISRFRDKALCNKRSNTFKLIEIPDSIREESRTQETDDKNQ